MVTSENIDHDFTYVEPHLTTNEVPINQETPVAESPAIESPVQSQPEKLEEISAPVAAEPFEKPLKNAFGIDMDLLAGLTAEIEATSVPSTTEVSDDDSFLASWHGKSDAQTEKVSLLDGINE